MSIINTIIPGGDRRYYILKDADLADKQRKTIEKKYLGKVKISLQIRKGEKFTAAGWTEGSTTYLIEEIVEALRRSDPVGLESFLWHENCWNLFSLDPTSPKHVKIIIDLEIGYYNFATGQSALEFFDIMGELLKKKREFRVAAYFWEDYMSGVLHEAGIGPKYIPGSVLSLEYAATAFVVNFENLLEKPLQLYTLNGKTYLESKFAAERFTWLTSKYPRSEIFKFFLRNYSNLGFSRERESNCRPSLISLVPGVLDFSEFGHQKFCDSINTINTSLGRENAPL